MNGISGLGVYEKNYYDSQVQNKKTNSTKKTQSKDKEVNLSDRAKELLKELKKTYGDIDFIVASYNSDEEADSYLANGTKEFSVLIDPEELEKMASDDNVKKKNLGIIEEAREKLSDMKENLGDKKDDVKRLGVSIDKNGTVTYFADLEKMSEKQRERIEKAREEKREYIGAHSNVKRTRVNAPSAEELLEKIKGIDWSVIQGQRQELSGGRYSFSI
ncbi:MAG: hypothetical protein K1W39_19050 [Lachnospiraceae bacterium]|jgi:hypothetical protein|nr:hypothetical protein [Lachnospiraceae bacterium]